ncbi:MAG: hypothetical protein KDJ16_00600 [Hyphomicrobiales bacterium]|nr:hypothetical protein [Hyphomicrobiales bacterium]
MRLSGAVLAVSICLPAAAAAGEAVIEKVELTRSGAGYRADVTVRHADSGWDHYADRWQVMTGEGTVLGERVLLHPHETEQPFTRSLSGIEIPADVSEVFVRAHDSVHGDGPRFGPVKVPK